MGDSIRYLREREPIEALLLAIGERDFELDRAEIELKGLVRVVTQKDFDGQDAHRIQDWPSETWPLRARHSSKHRPKA